MKKAVIAALLSLSTTGLMADVAPDPMTQDWSQLQVRDAKGVPVEMAWEVVDLTPSAEKCDCRVEFGLKNTSDKKASFEVGFPSLNQERLNDFVVMVDGKKVIPEVKKEVVTPEWAKNGGVGRRGNNSFRYWMTWKMDFNPRVERNVTITYWTKPTIFWRHNWGPKWRGAVGGVYADANVGWRKSGYILRTGASWKNKIGKATIRLHHDHVSHKDIDPRMSGSWTYNKEKNYSEKVLTNLEPNRNHDIQYFFRISTVEKEFEAMKKAAHQPLAAQDPGRMDIYEYLFDDLCKEISKKAGRDEAAAKKFREGLMTEVFVTNKAPMVFTNYVGGNSHYRYIEALMEIHGARGTMKELAPVAGSWIKHLNIVRSRTNNRFMGGDDFEKTQKKLTEMTTKLKEIVADKVTN